jgi:hypothetical protein
MVNAGAAEAAGTKARRAVKWLTRPADRRRRKADAEPQIKSVSRRAVTGFVADTRTVPGCQDIERERNLK